MQKTDCQPTKSNRIERIRKVLEEGEKDMELFSPQFKSYLATDMATERAAQAKPGYKAPKISEAATPEGGLELMDIGKIFSDYRISVTDAVEEGDRVVVRWRLRGTWTGPFPFPAPRPTDQPVDITGVNIYRFVGDKIVEKFGEIDIAGFHDAACERLNTGAERINPAECVKALQALARPVEFLRGGKTGPGQG